MASRAAGGVKNRGCKFEMIVGRQAPDPWVIWDAGTRTRQTKSKECSVERRIFRGGFLGVIGVLEGSYGACVIEIAGSA